MVIRITGLLRDTEFDWMIANDMSEFHSVKCRQGTENSKLDVDLMRFNLILNFWYSLVLMRIWSTQSTKPV